MTWLFYAIPAFIVAIVIPLVFIILHKRNLRKKKKLIDLAKKPVEQKLSEEEKISFELPPDRKKVEPKTENFQKGEDEFDDSFYDDYFYSDQESIRKDYLDTINDFSANRQDRAKFGYFTSKTPVDNAGDSKSLQSDEDFYDEDFENFRNEHCYSKYLLDKSLLEQLQLLPNDLKNVIFSDTLKRKDYDDINFGDKL